MQKFPPTILEGQQKSISPSFAKSKLIGIPVEIWITADPFIVGTVQRGNSSVSTPAPVNANLDLIFAITEAGIVAGATVTLSISGTWVNVGIAVDPFIVNTSITGTELIGGVWVASPFIVVTSLPAWPAAELTLQGNKQSWVKWSKVGYLDFTIDESNVAGEMPMDWKGWVYSIKKLDKHVVVYGQNGVTVLNPSGINYGMETIYRIGVKGKGAICGTDFEHYFIDILGQLWKVASNGLTKLGYAEYLLPMICPVMSLDPETGIIYICDGTYGYVYSTKDGSFGSGPVNITGVGSQTGSFYLTAPAAVTMIVPELCTDTYDMGTRKRKDIDSIEVGTDLASGYSLYASADYRLDKNAAFSSTNWVLVNPDGKAFPKCFGTEFRFRLKASAYVYFEVDYFNVKGVIYDYSYRDISGGDGGKRGTYKGTT